MVLAEVDYCFDAEFFQLLKAICFGLGTPIEIVVDFVKIRTAGKLQVLCGG